MFIAIAFASEHAVQTAEAAEEGLLASLGINPGLFVFQLINFAIVAVVLWFLILKPLTKKMAERQRLIDEGLDNAKKVQDNLARSEKDYQARIDTAKVEANRILEKANAETAIVADEMKVRARKEIETLANQAKRNIRAEKEEMALQLREETAGLVVMAVEKILEEKMDEKKDKKLIEEALKGLKS